MDGAIVVACTMDQATVTTNIVGVVLDNLTVEDDLPHFICRNKLNRRVHGIKRMGKKQNTLPRSLTNSL